MPRGTELFGFGFYSLQNVFLAGIKQRKGCIVLGRGGYGRIKGNGGWKGVLFVCASYVF